ncbi:MAG: T9SS type A sorting domain-containing protein [Bacteroidia bacterium]|nr:T9SS type A sorting domain-containing protein [Bacteroidia bacterium]
MKKLLVTVLALLCIPLMAQVLQPLGSGLPLSESGGSGARVVASYAAGNEYLALFSEPSTPDTTDYTVGRWNGAYWSYYPGLLMPPPVKLTAGGIYHFNSVVLFNDTMYVGAYIESPTDVQANVSHLYKWNGSSWKPMSNTIESANYGIMAMTVFDNRLIVAGRFQNNVNGTLVDNIAAYDGTKWSFLGKNSGQQGTDGDIKTLVTEGNRLYIGGNFQNFGGTLTGNLAYYVDETTPWGGVGSPFGGAIEELASYNNKIAAIGTQVNGDKEVRVFSNNAWSPAVTFSGFSKAIPTTIAGAKQYLLIGGDFKKDGNWTSLLRYENDSLNFTGNRITGAFKLGQRGSEAFIWGAFSEQNTGIKFISKIETSAGDVTGVLFFDKDQDLVQGNNEVGLGSVLVRFEDLSGSVWFATTDANGKFAVALPEGNYNISAFPGRHWVISNPSNYAVKARKGLYSTVALGQYMPPNTQDLELKLGAATGGDVQVNDIVKYVIQMKNTGNTVLNGPTSHFTHDARLTWKYANPEPDNYDAGRKEATYSILDLQPGETRLIEMYLQIPADATVSDKFECNLKTGSLFTTGDAYKADNYDTIKLGLQTADPDGSVMKSGTSGDVVHINVTHLEYKVDFVNISNSTVKRVVLLDTLDPNITLKYMMVTDLFPKGDWRIVKTATGDILVAEYPEANLSSRESNKNASAGWISYYLELKKPMGHDEQVHNRASCDFDNRWVGSSNTVTVTMRDPNIGVQHIAGNIGKVYPNPANASLTVDFVKYYSGLVELVDNTGRIVLAEVCNGMQHQLNIGELKTGIYALRTANGTATVFVVR